MEEQQFFHRPVLLKESLSYLVSKEEGLYVDCTLGGAGHSYALLKHYPKARLIGIDQDEEAIDAAKKRLAGFSSRVLFVQRNFRHLKEILESLGVFSVNGILMDIGVSSPQLDTKERGFSYQLDAPLDMRMDTKGEKTAFQLVNVSSEEELCRIFWEYGEERWGKRIASFIVSARKERPLRTTFDLVEVIKQAIPKGARKEGPHPAKRCFQALRIAVNEELEALKEALVAGESALAPRGRLCVITFHSLEDKMVKEAMKEIAQGCTCPKSLPLCVCKGKPRGRILTKKPISPSVEEVKENPRARSAKLRVLETLGEEEENGTGTEVRVY